MRPTRSQLERMKPGEFEQAMQQHMGETIHAMEDEAGEVEAAQKDIERRFSGQAADTEREFLMTKLATLHTDIEQCKAAQQALGRAGGLLVFATRAVFSAVEEAESIGFLVQDNWTLEPANRLIRLTMRLFSLGKAQQASINHAVDAWAQADHEGAQLVNNEVLALEKEFWSHEPTVKDGEGHDVPISVTANMDSSGRVVPDENDPPSDLNVAIPGWPGHTITGDADATLPGKHPGDPTGAYVDGVPGLVKDVPDKGLRALPTGANFGPDGTTPLAGFSFPDGNGPDGKKAGSVAEFASPVTTVFDMSKSPPQKIGELKDAASKNGISQGSFSYDKQSNCMVVVGNEGNADGSPRAVWKSDPIDPKDLEDPVKRNQWMNTLHKVPGSEQPISQGSNPIGGPGGDRENQVRQLPDGRWVCYDSKNGAGMRMYIADRPEDLFKGQPQQIAGVVNTPLPQVPPGSPPGAHYLPPMAYGASVVSETQNPDGSITQTVRASGWPPLVVPDPNYGKPGHDEKEMRLPDYSPQTYTYTVQIGAKH